MQPFKIKHFKLMKKIFLIAFLIIFNVSFSQDKVNQLDEKGLRHGLWKGIFEDTKRPRYEGVFNHGIETGIFKYFDNTKAGTTIATRDFSKGNGNCYVIVFDQKGNKVSEGNLVNKLHEGEWKFYHMESNNIMTLENYTADKLNGVRKVYYRSTTLAEETYYKNGLKNGISKLFSEKGVIIDEHNYKDDKFHGVAVYYAGSGVKLYEGSYANGLKTGIWKFYENGKVVKEVIAKVFAKELKLFEERATKSKMKNTDIKPRTKAKK
jgi:antitoxin component YwqK of YwqJK toxin-antitoxin module